MPTVTRPTAQALPTQIPPTQIVAVPAGVFAPPGSPPATNVSVQAPGATTNITTATPMSTGATIAVVAGIALALGAGGYAIYRMQKRGGARENPIGLRWRKTSSRRWVARGGHGSYVITQEGKYDGSTYYWLRMPRSLGGSFTLLARAKHYAWLDDEASSAREFPKSGQITWGPGSIEAHRT